MRPKSIAQFEIVFWLWLAANLLGLVVAWPATAAEPQMRQVLTQMPWFPYAVIAIIVLLLGWLGFATARRASNIGRWLFVLVAIVSVALVLPGLAGGNLPVALGDWLIVGAAVLAVVGAVLLFRADAKAWFDGSDDDIVDTVPVE